MPTLTRSMTDGLLGAVTGPAQQLACLCGAVATVPDGHGVLRCGACARVVVRVGYPHDGTVRWVPTVPEDLVDLATVVGDTTFRPTTLDQVARDATGLVRQPVTPDQETAVLRVLRVLRSGEGGATWRVSVWADRESGALWLLARVVRDDCEQYLVGVASPAKLARLTSADRTLTSAADGTTRTIPTFATQTRPLRGDQ